MSFSLVAHGVLAYEFNMVQTLLAEEEAHDDPGGSQKTAKSDLKDKYFSFGAYASPYAHIFTLISAAHNIADYPSGFFDKPYMPPKMM